MDLTRLADVHAVITYGGFSAAARATGTPKAMPPDQGAPRPCESFGGEHRDGLLDIEIFCSLRDAEVSIEGWPALQHRG